MPPPTCLVCYNLDAAKLRRLNELTCSLGQASRHWMSGYELKGSAAGNFPREDAVCATCALVRDAVESFLNESGLEASRCHAVDYLVAMDDIGQTDENGDENDETASETASQVTWQDVDDEAEGSDVDEIVDLGSTNLKKPKPVTTQQRVTPSLKLVLRLHFSLPRTTKDHAEEFELEVFSQTRDNPQGLSMVGRAQDVITTPETGEYAATIQGWLQNCVDHHHMCKTYATTQAPRELPKRVLDLSDNNIRLVEPGAKKDLYVALSHCWGREPLLTTTKETLASRKEGINLRAMPPTFQDAVLITSAMGLRYLWIDSLCIIQGDIKDWEEQSAVMADIYANCYLNIATTRSSGGAEGFLRPRWTSRDTWKWANSFVQASPDKPDLKPVSKIRKCEMKSYTVSSMDGMDDRYNGAFKVRLTLNSSHEAMQTLRWINMHKDTAPLIQRGWVYQERNLAPRTVHFHSNEMVWDCIEQQRCECRVLDGSATGGDGWSASKHRISTLSSLNRAQIHGLWRTVVEDYTLLDLTYETDRLPALGGLATRFSQHMPNDEYLAGMWKSTLARDLLWKLQYGEAGARRGALGVTTPPSWSWASLAHGDGRPGIRWEYETKPKLARWAETFKYKQDPRFAVLKASCNPTGPSPFGNVSGGSITVIGAMCAIALIPDTAPIPKGWADQIPITSQDEFNSLHLDYDDARDAEYVVAAENPVRGLIFCLFVGTVFSHFELDPKNSHPNHQGLILKPSAKVPGAAERIGAWNQHIESWTVARTMFTKDAKLVTVTIV